MLHMMCCTRYTLHNALYGTLYGSYGKYDDNVDAAKTTARRYSPRTL